MGVFFQKMMLNLPHIVKANLVGPFDLGQGFVVDVVLTQLVPRAGRFHFVQQTELHNLLLFLVIRFCV